MRIRIDGEKHDPFIEYNINSTVRPVISDVPVIVVTDPGKTNLCLCVTTVSGKILCHIEMSGKGMDTSDYCQELRDFYLKFLSKVKIYDITQEEIVTKKNKDGKYVSGYHISNKVLTEVRAMLIDSARLLIGRNPKERNNMHWKFMVLPGGYRGKYQKGSLLWLGEHSKHYRNCTDDVTDVICMAMAESMYYERDNVIMCIEKEHKTNCREFAIVSEDCVPIDGVLTFVYNNKFSLEDNVNYFTNRSEKAGVCDIDIFDLTVQEIFKYSSGLMPSSITKLFVTK